MLEGWQEKNYFILFENEDEQDRFTKEYSIARFLPGHTIVGLIGWDDFIVKAEGKGLFTVPTVPLKAELLKPFGLSIDTSSLLPDERVKGKIKWYIQPIAFGGDATNEKNMAWISMKDHIAAVNYWNQLYRDLSKPKA